MGHLPLGARTSTEILSCAQSDDVGCGGIGGSTGWVFTQCGGVGRLKLGWMGQAKQMRWLRCAVRVGRVSACVAGLGCVAVVCCGAAGLSAETRSTGKARVAKKVVALSPWEQAEQGRDALEATAQESRTRAEYTRVMDAYRAIYHANPADAHSPAAVNAVAELLAEQGRGLAHNNDLEAGAKSLQSAVGQYEFLLKQYPASSLGVQALLAEGQIEQDDLNDASAAKEKYRLLLKEHPRSEQAEEAKAGLASLQQLPVVGSQQSGKTAKLAVIQPIHHDSGAMNGAPGLVQTPSAGGSSLPAMAQTSGVVEPAHRANAAMNGAPRSVDDSAQGNNLMITLAGGSRDHGAPGKLAGVTGIRHWSTATYTRVAIDLGDSVTYEAARVPNPDRIYFDLHGTKLAPELVGKSFTVTDDGFLKKVRAAQYTDDVTRVVLDVNDVTEYSAFLLPNPYRLIIDIHGSKAGSSELAGGNSVATTDVPAPHTGAAGKDSPGRPVPNTVATKSASATSEVANLSDLPGKVEATKKPTSKPISAVVDPGISGTDSAAAQPTHRDTAAMNGAQVGAAEPARRDDSAMVGAQGALPTPKSRKGRRAADAVVAAGATPARAAVPTADGETSLVRALGLKIGRIVIDAGHGGHDSGTLGAGGIQEKDVVLDVALRLGKLLHDRLGAEIIYTRSDDTFIPLETRTAIANKAQADLFLSIHANSSPDASARGVETYYLNFTSDPTALDVAARENAVSDQSIHQLSDLVKKIALKDKIAESREFAADVEGSLYAGLEKGNAGLKDRGVKKAPFVVLIGANMPSILAEISFVTNPTDAEQLEQPEYRERVAESIYKGVARYESGLSGAGRKDAVATERAAVGQ
jgi:N-acetylmuramoyl-L-alanine amidase